MKMHGFLRVFFLSTVLALFTGCPRYSADPTRYEISPYVKTTRDEVITFSRISSTTHLWEVRKLLDEGFGKWSFAPGSNDGTRVDLMPASYRPSPASRSKKLLNFMVMTDVHITDKESPSQPLFLARLHEKKSTPVYSPVMLYSTQVLDAAIRTINAVHQKKPIDFLISLGDVANDSQYNELRWYIDVLDGKVITPSSGAHAGSDSIDYQKPFKAAGLDHAISWYQAVGNHDHLYFGTFTMDERLRASSVSDTINDMSDPFTNKEFSLYQSPKYYTGTIDGSTTYGTIIHVGPVTDPVFAAGAPKVVADQDRRSVTRKQWMTELFSTTTNPVGHGFSQANLDSDFSSYSFLPKANVPVKVIVLDDTSDEIVASRQSGGRGFLNEQRYQWLVRELEAGQADDQLMIVAAHVPLGVEKATSLLAWDDRNSFVTEKALIARLQSYPNLLLWIAGHRHLNVVKAFQSPEPDRPELGFWQVETSSLRDFPQQIRQVEILSHDDSTVSILVTNIDPAVKEGTPAATSRTYAVLTEQRYPHPGIYQSGCDKDPTPRYCSDNSIRPIPSGSYSAELLKKVSPRMAAKLDSLNLNP
jgi:metallophosphoesterase (TIGR03768 family)